MSSIIAEAWSFVIKTIAATSLSIGSLRPAGKIIKEIIYHGGIKRKFLVYLPLAFKGEKLPLVFALHGRGANAESMILLTRQGFNRLADTEGFLAVYPDAVEMNWNDGRSDEQSRDRAHSENIDDVGFINTLIDIISREFSIDEERVYVTGISNGAIMAYRLACELSHRIAAIAPVNGNIPVMLTCSPRHPVSLLAINNTEDPLIPFEGGEVVAGFEKVSLGHLLSVKQTVKFWISHNRCIPCPIIYELPDRDPYDGTRVTMKKYINIAEQTEVILYSIEGGGHTWPGGLQYMPSRFIGKTCRDFDANEVIWSFFKNHKRKMSGKNEGKIR